MSPRPPPTVSFKDNWMKELDSEKAGSSKDTHWIQPKPKTQLSRTERPVGEQQFTQEIENDVLFGREGTKHSTRTERPVDGPQSIQSCVSMPVELVDKYEDKDEDVDADQTRTGRPVGGQQFTQLEEIDIDFRVPGLSHAVVKEAGKFRVQELVKRIENLPHREALHADLQQNEVYNLSSKIRKRWSANWATWSYSSCAKLYQKYNVLTVFFVGIKELCTALADNAWLTANLEESSTNYDWMHSLSRTTW